MIALLVALQAAVSAASLVVEIVAGRMIAPYVGMSLYTWTAIIAVVLAGFSAGHWIGGRVAARDNAAALRVTGWTMLGAALTTGGAAWLLRQTAGPVLTTVADPLSAITALTMAVFFLPSLFAGIPAPVLAVVAMRGNPESERALGAMFASGAIGAIAGTLLAGFVFVSWIGSTGTLAAVTVAYAAVALILFRLAGRARWPLPYAAAALPLGLAWLGATLPAICDTESQYYCIRTVDISDGGPQARLMVLDHLAHGMSAREDAGLMLNEHAAMLDALPRMRLGDDGFSSFHIGGGSFSVPRAWAARGMDRIVVAEVDPAVTATAARDFWFDPASAEVVHADARVTLTRTAERFDVVVGDAFTDIAVPAHLVTREFFALVRDRLTDRGVYVMNVIDNVDRLDAILSLRATLRGIFPSVEVWSKAAPPVPGERRVFVILAGPEDSPASRIVTNAPEPMTFAVLAEAFLDAETVRRSPPILTDDYAPIDRLVGLEPLID